jgi:hypothetical protein
MRGKRSWRRNLLHMLEVVSGAGSGMDSRQDLVHHHEINQSLERGRDRILGLQRQLLACGRGYENETDDVDGQEVLVDPILRDQGRSFVAQTV